MSLGKKEFVDRDIDQLQILIKSSTLFIDQSLEYIVTACRSKELDKEKASGYFSEILHSILFIGYINAPSIEPRQLLPENVVNGLKEKYPAAFEKYKTHLPSRTPYSILLDMVVHTAGDRAMEKLLDLNEKMHVPQSSGKRCGNDFCLASTVVSYCYFEDKRVNKNSKKYYGASVACTGKPKRDFFINLSCVKTWNRKVALGVCLAAKNKESILLPATVHSAAFVMFNNQRDEGSEGTSGRIVGRSGQIYVPKPPCEKCWKIFPGVAFLPPNRDGKTAEWKYGNCAECEAISNLLNGEAAVDEGVQLGTPPQPLTTTAANEKLIPLLNPRIDNMKNTLKNRIKAREFVYFSP